MDTETNRKLATVRRIAALEPIEGADKILCATIDGWKLVTAKDNGFDVGDLVIYLEVDSWVPTEIAPFLSKGKEPREYNGVKGERLRTIKLRGQISQGLILPLDEKIRGEWAYAHLALETPASLDEGTDLTEFLNIQKWEKPIPAQLAGTVRGNFPSFLRKTDQERVQNLVKELAGWRYDLDVWEITEKLDGSSMTVYFKDGEFGVCSRNLDLKEDENNAFWSTANSLNLREKLTAWGRNIAIQGELIGEGVQNNLYKLKGRKFMVFDMFDIDNHRYYDSIDRLQLVADLELEHAPVISVDSGLPASVDDALAAAEGKSLLNKEVLREGIVYKNTRVTDRSFKAISNAWLLKNE